MKHSVILLIAFLINGKGFCQPTFADTAAAWFDELRIVAKQNAPLWKMDLYAPVLLVNPANREVFANVPDSAGQLQLNGSIYAGFLPQTVNISNTSVTWAGQHWAMVMLPLPETRNSRIQLLIHELFHRAQQQLGFLASNPENNHLDKKDGRVLLRLELEALRKAVLSPTRVELMKHIANAIYFRRQRHQVYPGSDTTENLLELNEGLSEFTGFMMSGREGYEARKYFANRITSFTGSGSFIRSFAYETIPVYGFLLNPTRKGWNREITSSTNLAEFFASAFGIEAPAERRKNNAAAIGKEYGYTLIVAEENAREEQFNQQFAKYRQQFIDTIHIEIPLISMSMSFDYTQQFSMDTLGMVYPSIRITDRWGILEAEKGVLINPGWNQANISYPLEFNGNKISGDGWILELAEGYSLEKDEEKGFFIVKKTGD